MSSIYIANRVSADQSQTQYLEEMDLNVHINSTQTLHSKFRPSQNNYLI